VISTDRYVRMQGDYESLIGWFRGHVGPCMLCGKETLGFGVWHRENSTLVTFYHYCGCEGTDVRAATLVEEAYAALVAEELASNAQVLQ